MVNRTRIVFINSLLLVGLAGLLIAYLIALQNLPSQIYSASQLEYLRYNIGRSIAQLAPTWNIVQADGQVEATILPVQESRVQASLYARYDEHEGVSATLYDLDFRGQYRLVHPGPAAASIELFFPFPRNLQTLHAVRFLVDGEEPPDANFSTSGIGWSTVLEAGQEREIVISYQADGANSFGYSLHHNQRTDVDVTLRVLGLTGSQVPRNSLPPTSSKVDDDGQIFTWSYTGLIADRDIQLSLPSRPSFAQRLSQSQDDFRDLARLAPILVGLFLASLAGVLHLSGIHLQLESYLLAGLGLALFYPTLTFLSGIVGVILASVLALTLISGLLLAFFGLAAGWRNIWWRVALLLLIFLGFFSLGILTPWRGLLLSAGGLLLVGVFMLIYARRPAPAEPQLTSLSPEASHEPDPDSVPIEAVPEPVGVYCSHCGRVLEDEYHFCPGCGQDTSHFRRCQDCGHRQFVPDGVKAVHCICCGQLLN